MLDRHLKVLNIIKDIVREKEAKKISPAIALTLNVWRRLNDTISTDEYADAIRYLKRAGKIEAGMTINQIYFKLKTK